ncbi:MAG: nitroreductase family protein [Acidimicrobiia bacterium]|nr:nitroreductase family protein [Acidimicrobiia bacterium]
MGLDPWISRAPVHIVLCVSEEAYHRRYQETDKTNEDGSEIEWPVPYWWVDAGAAMQNMLVAAVAEDLAAGFLGAHAAPEIGAMLGVPDEYAIVGIITIGHPAPDRRSGSLQRGWRDQATVVHRDRWTGRTRPAS